MEKSTTSLETPLREQLDLLAAFEPVTHPVLSLYLDLRPDQHGRDNYQAFLRKVLKERAHTLSGDDRASFDRDSERITSYLDGVPKSANAVAIFACAAAGDFFEALQLNAPIDEHWLFVGAAPHLYPLARLNDQYPRYAALLVDTNSARLFVFALGMREGQAEVQNVKTRRTSVGGWSQARYQRHVENFHLLHIKEVVDVLDRVVSSERLNHIIVSSDEVTKPLLLEQLPRHLMEKVIDFVTLDSKAPEHQVLAQTLDALKHNDGDTDAARVEEMLGEWRAGGLATAGPESTLQALSLGQVEELLITATPDQLRKPNASEQTGGNIVVDTSAPGTELDPERFELAGELVTKAHQTRARVRFIENPELLSEVGGVGALLRFRL